MAKTYFGTMYDRVTREMDELQDVLKEAARDFDSYISEIRTAINNENYDEALERLDAFENNFYQYLDTK